MSDYTVTSGELSSNFIVSSGVASGSFIFNDTPPTSLYITTSVTYSLWNTMSNQSLWQNITSKWEEL